MEEVEIWKSIPDWEHYEVSSLGRVRKGDFMPRLRNTPYGVSVFLNNWSVMRSAYVHNLAAEAFWGKKKAYHADGNKENNRLDNLVDKRPASYVKPIRVKPAPPERVSKGVLELIKKPGVSWDEIAVALGFQMTSKAQVLAHIKNSILNASDAEKYGSQ
ncbi:NUMOD4 domain-containing protein [Hymenobacter cavernae]|uniref:NUMOD4 domain-containing protein n=1 Tax=Hymenobacter cavernae TaxID=2044852 RepID=A0ABQ1UQB2_9BACT|nr:NUMOD4 domain-containing protein [Hymenobacter cavernae]GGF23361.1 hypothetical protein GCM10011383_38740 [Hymenobacter cavernae]